MMHAHAATTNYLLQMMSYKLMSYRPVYMWHLNLWRVHTQAELALRCLLNEGSLLLHWFNQTQEGRKKKKNKKKKKKKRKTKHN